MRRALFRVTIFFVLIVVAFTNEMIKIDYNLNLIEYISLSREYSAYERAVLENHGTIIYGGNITEPPLGKYYEDTGQYLGLVTDFIYALAIELETDIVMRPMVWDEALEALKTGEIDLCDLTPSSERSKYYSFTDKIYDLNGVALVNSDAPSITHISDLSGQNVGVQRGDYIIESLSEQSVYPNYHYADDLTTALEMLFNGEVDAIVGDEPVIINHLNDARNVNKYEILNEKVYESYVSLGIPKDRSELEPILNKAIFRMKKSGILYKIQGKWLGYNTAAEEKRTNEKMKRTVAAIFALFGTVMYVVYAWNRNLKTLVDNRTVELRTITYELETILNNIKSTILLIDKDGIIIKVKGEIPGIKNMSELPSRIQEIDFLNILKESLNQSILIENDRERNKIDPINVDVNYINRIYECYLTPIDGLDPLNLIIITDVTLDRIQKSQLIHTNKMEAVGRLAAGIAHELRNPLGIVRNSTFILKDVQNRDDDELMAISAIDRSVDRAGKIIENLLNYSRLNESKDGEIKLNDMLEEIINYYKKSIDNARVKFRLHIEPLDMFLSNESAIRHIVMNLVGNSVDAVADEGEIDIHVFVESNQVNIKISDSGCGIRKNELDKIFDPFFTTKSVGSGTGLGLYIVHSQVEKIGGTIEVHSELEVGTTFVVCIPVMR